MTSFSSLPYAQRQQLVKSWLEENRARVSRYLTYRERSVLELQYGLSGIFHTRPETGRLLQMTVDRVKHLESKGIERIDQLRMKGV